MQGSLDRVVEFGRHLLKSSQPLLERARHLLQTRRPLVLGVGGVAVVVIGFLVFRGGSTDGAAQSQQRSGVEVSVARAIRAKVPVRLEALGTVTTIASVAIKTRVDSEITAVHFTDGTRVNTGDILFTLDSRAIEAQVRQAEGMLARDQAQLAGAERDVKRYTELVEKGATPTINLDNAVTQAETFRAAIKADQAALDNLKVQLTYCVIRAPISGRVSTATVKVGNFVRQADLTPLAVINQIAPIYITYSVPQRSLPDVRRALGAETATVEAIIPGEPKRAPGQVTVIENTVDPTTGMVTIRATMPNSDELLWPGTLVNVMMTLRVEEAVVVPSIAVQVSQNGTFVFVVKNGTATVQPVKVARTLEDKSVIAEGLQGDELVITDNHLRLSNGTRVIVRDSKAGT
jgi:membrane fusion protein, multidrug efflux system